MHALPLGDDFSYEESFPEVATLAAARRTDLVHVLSLALDQDLEEDDPEIWDTCAEACDWLLEQAEAYLKNENDGKVVVSWSQTARQQSQSAFGRIVEGTVEMEKPQLTYRILSDNERSTPFVPKAHADKPFGVEPLDLTPRPGRAADTRYGGTPDVLMDLSSDERIGPDQHVPHPYRHEIQSLDCNWTVPESVPDTPSKPQEEVYPATWVDNEQELEELSNKLESVKMVAVDLEAHNYRSFAGMTCLMQLSFFESGQKQNYLVDTLALWHVMNARLAKCFANPAIVKVMHGADSDVAWLQRDFGIYVVNLLDTGRACRLLQYPSFGLAHLLQRNARVVADKKHQLSDWRQRPLPDEMRKYAVMDTYFLLEIAETLLYEVDSHKSPEVTIEKLFETSQAVTLIRYDKEAFRPKGYKSLINDSKRKSKSELTGLQERVLKSLYDWRDSTARDRDESIHYVCPNKALVRLALSCPTSVSSLQSILNPMPPLVLRLSSEVLAVVQKENHVASAFFKPAVPEKEGTPTPTRGILSPVLGTEALYKQAGWTTPQIPEVDAVVTTTTDDDEGGSKNPDTTKPRKLLSVDKANGQYNSAGFTSHSLSMSRQGRGRISDVGTADVLVEQGMNVSAKDVRKTMENKDVLGLIGKDSEEDQEEEEEEEDEADKENGEESEDDFQIPRSLREIYKISNRNRRNKKASSPPPASDRGNVKSSVPEDELAKANQLLASKGAYGQEYFDSANKRQRKGDDDGASGRTDDIEFMAEIGWIKDKKEAQELQKEATADNGSDGGDTTEAKEAKSFDYSSIGNIGVYNPGGGHSNPFFAGGAGAFSQTQRRGRDTSRKGRGGRGGSRKGSGQRQERPEKRDGRTFVYKKK